MTTDELQRMAARSEEDGHDRAWIPVFAGNRRNLDAMIKAADHAKAASKRDEEAFVPSFLPKAKLPNT